MSETAHEEILDLSRQLLKSIHEQDWNAYAKLCDPSLTCFEPEARGHLVAGLPFHKFYFDMEASGRPAQSTMASPHVRVMGDVAVVTYVRLTQRIDVAGHDSVSAVSETRVWQRQGSGWKHVHFHRSAC
jgi:ketosteroid isomerase-like protein